MIRQVASLLGKVLIQRCVAQATPAHSSPGVNFFDLKFGMRLMKDRRVPFGSKLQSLFLGALFAGILQLVEVPLETVLLVVMPLLGLADVAFDGIEVIAASILGAALVLPLLAPKELVARMRREGDGRVYEAATSKVR